MNVHQGQRKRPPLRHAGSVVHVMPFWGTCAPFKIATVGWHCAANLQKDITFLAAVEKKNSDSCQTHACAS